MAFHNLVLGTETLHHAQVAAGFLRLKNKTVATAALEWDRNFDIAHISWDYLKYCYWEFPGLVSGSYRFVLLADLLAWLATQIGLNGSHEFLNNCYAKVTEQVNPADKVSIRISFRNSLVAALKGRNEWHQPPSCGVSAKFNTGLYYTGWGNIVAKQLIYFYTGYLPTTNNDNIIWWTHQRNQFGYLKVGQIYYPRNGSNVAWDTVTHTYGSPVGAFTIQNPIYLVEPYRSRSLEIYNLDTAATQVAFIQGVVAACYPVISGNQLSFIIAAMGFDTFFIDKLQSNEELWLRVIYKREKAASYVKMDEITSDSTNNTSMFNLVAKWNEIYKGVRPLTGRYASKVATQLEIMRRNTLLGTRTEYSTIAKILVDVPSAGYYVMPRGKML